MQATLQQLQNLAIFAQVEPQFLAPLVAASQVKRYQQGEIVIHEGDRFPDKLHALLEGGLLVQKIAASGKETTLGDIRQRLSQRMAAMKKNGGEHVG